MFCPKCNYKLDLTKDILINDQKIKTAKILGVADFIRAVVNNNSVLDNNNINLNFNIDILKNNENFKRIEKTTKATIVNKFNEIKAKTISSVKGSGIYLICKICGYYTPIKNGMIVHSDSFGKEDNILFEEDYKLYCDDPTLPRTKNFICPNKTCITHDKRNKKIQQEKEAVWFKHDNTYKTTYICCTCNTHWNL